MLKILKRLESKNWVLIAVSLIFILMQVGLDLKLPDYMSEITRLTQTPGSDIVQIWEVGKYMLLCVLGSLVAAIAIGFIASRIAMSFARNLRSQLFEKVNSFSMEEINRFSTASLITRSTNDVTQVEMLLVMGLQLVIRAPIMAVWAIIKIVGKGFEWAAITAGVVLLLVAVIVTIMVLLLPKFKKMQSLTDNLNRATRENLTGLRIVRAYNANRFMTKRFEDVNKDLTSTQLFTSRGMSIMLPLIMYMMSLLNLFIYWIGAYLINAAPVADKLVLFSDMVVFSSYSLQVIMAFMMLVMLFVMLPRASVSAGRINEVLDTKVSIREGTVTGGKPGLAGELTFQDVSFKYPGSEEYVLQDINFTARKGETIAFIGSTGSAKTTLVNLILRFYDTTEGEVLVDGVNVRDYTQEALYNKIGYVPQKAVLFQGTVNFNVGYGDNGQSRPSEDAIKRAVAIAQGADFVEKMEGQYEAPIAQRGTNVSGGQKQRLSIARAICREPEIYIFDDSFSALDYKTDRQLRSALKKEAEGITTLIVAQRIGTIMDADQIIVLDEGKIVGKGTHKELMATCQVYQEIAMSQLSVEELQ